MSNEHESDLYEALQVSPRADQDTIERVFRHMAKRFHPDNAETGNTERFNEVMEAYKTLSDPERRAAYDARYTEVRRQQWKLFDQASATDSVESDRRIRIGALTLLYQARRRDVDRPGVGILDLERTLDCPPDHMRFHLWYLKEKGWIQRLDSGLIAITVDGVEKLHEEGVPWTEQIRRLPRGRDEAAEAEPVTDPMASRVTHVETEGPISRNGTFG